MNEILELKLKRHKIEWDVYKLQMQKELFDKKIEFNTKSLNDINDRIKYLESINR